MNRTDARDLGHRIAALAQSGDVEAAYSLLVPVLSQKIPFPKLDLVGEIIGTAPVVDVNPLLDRICQERTMGGWVVIGKALGQQLESSLPDSLDRCRTYIIDSNVWYGADILGERVPGPALVLNADPALEHLQPWRAARNHWIRRSVGVAVHFWAKRSGGDKALIPRAAVLLDFLDPMFAERELSAIKGIGWGLKTLGKHYPDLVLDWLLDEILPSGRGYHPLMMRKTIAYLPDSHRAQLPSSPS